MRPSINGLPIAMDRGVVEDVFSSEIEHAGQIGSRYRGPQKVVFVVNTDHFFLSHRATWGVALQAAGAAVTVLAEDTGEAETIRRLGFGFVSVRVGRETSAGAFAMLKSAIQILFTLLRIRPNVVFLVHQVAYTLGWPAAIFLRRSTFIRVAGGLGRALAPGALRTRASRVVQASAGVASRMDNVFTLFQLEQDRQTFLSLGLLRNPDRSRVIAGTGIDVETWDSGITRDFTNPVILFASRLIREKGIYEFVKMAERLRGRGWRFVVAGDPDPGVESSVSSEEVQRWHRDGAVQLLGYRADMDRVFAEATMLVFPTRHPEGTPKVLIEAGASGLPSVVSGHAGCVAVVDDGMTGIVLGSQPSVEELEAAVAALASNADAASQMGEAARVHVSKTFSLDATLGRLLVWEAVGAVHS